MGQTCSCQKHKVSGMGKSSIKGYPVERLAIIGAGAVGAEFAVNSLVNNLTKDGKMPILKKKGVPGAIKIGLGVALLTMSKNKQVQDAGIGAIAAGGLGVARSFLSIPSIDGVYEDLDTVNGTVIDLDQVAGSSYLDVSDEY